MVLLSGGLDSATTLAIARRQGYAPHTITFDYGQRHRIELTAAAQVARSLGSTRHLVVNVGLGAIATSALTIGPDVPKDRSEDDMTAGIPVTYVPARNTVFLSLALAWAEALGARDIFIGVNAVDYSGYPDCRPAFIDAFARLADLATKAGVEGEKFTIHTPLISMSKADIIREGTKLGVDYALTHSCYDPDADCRPCRRCDSCLLRAKGFAEAGIDDPLLSGMK